MSRYAFAKQSALILIASHSGSFFLVVLAGVVQRHLDAAGSNTADYSLYMALRGALTQFSIPLLGMQTAFAQLAAKRAAEDSGQPLSGAVRGVLRASLIMWAGFGIVCFLARDWISVNYKLPNLSILGYTLLAGWALLTTPLLLGLLQGRQRFVRFSISKVLADVSLVGGVIVALALWQRDATSAMAGLCLGAWIGCLIAFAMTRADWAARPEPFKLGAFLKGLVPMTLGLGIAPFMLSEDQLLIQRFFDKGTNDYMAGRQIGTIAYFLMLPLTYVLVPKVVDSLARSTSTTAFRQALGATALVTAGGATFLSLFPKLPLWLLSKEKFLHAAHYVPKFCWAFVPLALFTILVNNLLARERYRAVPVLIAVAAAYSLTLRLYHPSMDAVIALLGVFSTLLLGVAAWFTWKD